jgi:chromosome segregation ATPase
MDEKQVSFIKKALQDTAGGLRPGSASEKTVRNSVLSLLRAEEQVRQPLSALSEAELADLLKYNRRLIDTAVRFLTQMMELPLTPEQSAQADQLQQRIRSAQASMDVGRRELAELNGNLARISADCAVQSAANDSLRSQVEQQRTALEHLQATESALQEDLKTYSDEVIQAQSDKNAALARQVAGQQAAFKELESQYRELENKHAAEQRRLEDQQAKVNSLQEQINAQPAELRALEERFSALEAQLFRIQNAAEECSEERQAELREQLASLEPEVNALVEKHSVLKAALEQLETAHESQLEENAAAEERLLSSMNAAVDTLQAHSQALAEKLKAAMARSQQFEENLRLCRESYDRYHNWFASDAPALTAICIKAGLSEKEYRTLYETLDPARCSVVQRLMQETEEHLRELDQILSEGSAAAQRDQADTRNRAELGEIPSARS